MKRLVVILSIVSLQLSVWASVSFAKSDCCGKASCEAKVSCCKGDNDRTREPSRIPSNGFSVKVFPLVTHSSLPLFKNQASFSSAGPRTFNPERGPLLFLLNSSFLF